MAGDRPSELDRAYRVGAAATDAPTPLPDRRGTVRAFGIVQIVLGGICGLIVLGALGIASKRMAAAPVTAYVIPAANLLLTGIGSLKIERWARRATVISSGIWLGLSLLFIVGKLAKDGGALLAMHGRGLAVVAAVMVPAMLISIGLPITLIIVYTRPSVRATFERRQAS